MNELQFQKALVDAVRDCGGYAHKLSNRFLVGIPDLLVKLPEYPACLIECKRNANKGRGEYLAFTPNVTELQGDNLERFQSAGGVSGVAILIDQNWPQYIYAAPYMQGHKRGKVECQLTTLLVRKRGEPWPIVNIVKQIVQGVNMGTFA